MKGTKCAGSRVAFQGSESTRLEEEGRKIHTDEDDIVILSFPQSQHFFYFAIHSFTFSCFSITGSVLVAFYDNEGAPP